MHSMAPTILSINAGRSVMYEEPDKDVVEMKDWFDDDGGVGVELKQVCVAPRGGGGFSL
jgi:hypothetical protein